jgi:hypothetical protein
MMAFVRRHPFLLFGLLTLGCFFAVDALSRNGYSDVAAAAARPLRVIIIPMYLVWMLFTIVHVAVAGPTRASGAVRQLIGICGVIAGLAPYALADYLLARWRRSHRRTAA